MNAYYTVTQKLKTLLLADENVNTVTKGDAALIDSNKKNIFPLVHMNVLSVSFTSTTITFSMVLEAVNLHNTSKTPTTDKFIGNDNEDDNLNSMMYVLIRLFLQLEKFGDSDGNDDFRVSRTSDLTPILAGRTNVHDGWGVTFDIEIDLKEISAC